LIFTVIAFWPRNAALWAIAKGSPNAIKDTTEILTMVHQWVTYDWIRIIMMMVGYAASIRAISIPFPQLIENVSTSLTMKIIYSVCIGIIFLFIAYFLSVIL